MKSPRIARWVLLSFAALIPCLTGCASDKAVMAQADQFDGNIHPAEIADPRVIAYFTKIGRRIQASAKQADAAHFGPSSHFARGGEQWMFSDKVQFHLVNSKTLNAFTTGGYHVYVYNELFQQTRSEDELAAVMAHEFGHIYCRHVHKGMNRQMAALGITGLAGAAGYVAGGSQNGATYAQAGASAGQMAGQFINMGFTRGDEAQADEVGFHFYTLAGWDPRHFSDFFKRMIELGYDKTPAMMSDHPTLASRVQATDKRVAALGGDVEKLRGDDSFSQAEFDRVKQLAVSSGQTIPNDAQALQAKQMLQALPRSCWVPYEPEDRTKALDELAAKFRAARAAAASSDASK